ncbi:MAG TPA: very short patch repair endonuclease [Phycisphaerae bacterium]|nr:very short patch repair endonuclease [Phycisphaerae bacterium]
MTDNLTREQRSFCMSRVKGKDTKIEQRVRSALHRRGLRFRKHVATLPGKPDVVFLARRVVVFIDGDFWHGYRFPAWEHTLSRFWRRKIAETRVRDQRNFRCLRRAGWRVIRLWQHQIEEDLNACLDRIHAAMTDLDDSPRASHAARQPRT